MRVYKFIDARWGEEAIRRRRLKISLIHELNDPYEGRCARFSTEAEHRAWDQARVGFSKKHGLICFSEKWGNPVLWAHYADMHRGICLGFDLSDQAPARAVNYDKNLVDGRKFQNWDKGQQWQFAQKVYSTKFLDWQYETEIRAFCDLDEPDPITGKFLRDFKPDMQLREVIFGAHFSGDAPYLRTCLSDLPNIEFKTARLTFDTFSVVEQNDKQLQR